MAWHGMAAGTYGKDSYALIPFEDRKTIKVE